jgi:16S rRNA (adenine1518-N6/adenine1519-N6)-dimethyltransferase
MSAKKTTGHQPRKRFGQNFLHDLSVISKLSRAINAKPSDNMVEIGPGQGALTEPLLQTLNHLNAVELDRDLIPLLQSKFTPEQLTIHSADALKFDFSQLFGEQALRVVGNLPYNISTPLLIHLLSYQQNIKDMHFMLQLEVVDRLAAVPGNKNYGRLSVVSQYFCQVDKLFNVPPGAFNPPPKVMSAIVRLEPRVFSEVASDEALFQKLVKTAFAQRRKTLRNNLKQLFDSEQLEQISAATGVNLADRPEQISVKEYVMLANQAHLMGL